LKSKGYFGTCQTARQVVMAAMRDFTKFPPTIWHLAQFRELPTDSVRYLYIYYLTNAHQNSAGCYRLPDGYAAEDLGWSLDDYRNARSDLLKHQLIAFDSSTSEVLIEGWFNDNAPINPKHRIGTERIIAKIRSASLRESAEMALKATSKHKENDARNAVLSLQEKYLQYGGNKKR
jgi:hypothetical protein